MSRPTPRWWWLYLIVAVELVMMTVAIVATL